ncbi:MAG: response regulator [Verrucomicrobiae bacterium]|nr:response regulator [Verrucomicrobiae bacterium]
MCATPLKILVVDNEDFLRTLLDEILRTLGFQPAIYGDAQAAIEAFRDAMAGGEGFDLVVLDLRLAGEMDGVSLLRELRKTDPNVKALAISGRLEEGLAVPPGFQGFLSKPFRIKALADALTAVRNSVISPS